MTIVQKWNKSSLAKALEPGIESAIGRMLDRLINEAVKEAEDRIRKELVDNCAIKLKKNIKSAFDSDKINYEIDFTVGEKS